MELPQNEEKQQFDFIGSLAKQAIESEAAERGPAGKAVDDALKNLAGAQQKAREEFKKERNWQIKVANEIEEKASKEAQEAAAYGLDGAKTLIKEYRSLKGFTYNDLLKAGGYTQELPEKEMGRAEMITRLSMAILPGLAGFIAGKATGSTNPYIMAAGGAEAGVKGLQYLDELDKEKRKRASERQLAGIKATMQEAQDERRMMREALLMPQKARLEAQELGRQLQLTAARESLGRVFEPRKETPEEIAAREGLRQATELEKEQLKERKKKPKLSTAAESYIRKTAPLLATRAKTVTAIDAAIGQLEDPNISEEQKVLVGNTLLKQMNDPDNPDALQQAEAARLNPYLNYQMFNILPGSPGAVFGRDIPKFTQQIKGFRDRLLQGYETLSKDITEIEQTGELPKYSPKRQKEETLPPGGFIKPTADLLKKLSAEEKRQYVQGDRETQQKLLKKVSGAK